MHRGRQGSEYMLHVEKTQRDSSGGHASGSTGQTAEQRLRKLFFWERRAPSPRPWRPQPP